MEADNISAFPVSPVENSKNVKKNVSFNIQSNILYFDKMQSSSFLEGMTADDINTFPVFHDESSENINLKKVSGTFCNDESETPFVSDVDQTKTKHNAVEKPYVLFKNLVVKLEKLPLNILNKFNCENDVCDEGSKNVLLEKPKDDLSSNLVQKKTKCTNQNGGIYTPQAINAQDLKYDKSIIGTNSSDSLFTKDNTFRQLKVCLQQLPDNLLTVDNINLQNLKQVIPSSSVNPAKNQCNDQRSSKRPKHKISKSKHKILKLKKKLLKLYKQNNKHFEKKGRCDSFIPLQSVQIHSEESIKSKSPEHNQKDNVKTALCMETGRFNTSFDVHSLSSDNINASAISKDSSISTKPVKVFDDNIALYANSSSVRLSLLLDKEDKTRKEVSSDAETCIKDPNNNLTNSVTKVNSTENQNLLTEKDSYYLNYCNISLKKPVVQLERLNLVLPEIECKEMNAQTTIKEKLQKVDNSHSQSTSGKIHEASNVNVKHKSSREEFKIVKRKKIEQNLPSFNSGDLSVNNLSEDDVPLLLFANNNQSKKKDTISKKKIKNKSKPFKKTQKFSKLDSKALSSGTPCEEDVPLLLLANNKYKKKLNYFDYKKTINKNKSKSSKKAKKFSKFDSKFLSKDTLCEDDVPLFLFANNNDEKEQNNFTSKKKIKNNKSNDSTTKLKTITMDHSYFCSPSSMNVESDSDTLILSSDLRNVISDHNYMSYMQTNHVKMQINHVPSELPKKSRKESGIKKPKCPTCVKMINPHIFLKTYMNKFCSSFDNLGKKEKSLLNVDQKKQTDIEIARKKHEYGYNYIINKLHTHLEVTCPVKESYKKQCNQNAKSTSLYTNENNIQTTDIQASSANEENNYDLSELLFAAKKSSNNQHKSKSRVDKYRLGFLAANNPLRLYNKCLASERYLLSKYEMTNGQRKKLKKMFTSLKNNAAAIEKIE